MPHPLDLICAVLRRRLNGEPLDPGVIPALRRGGVDDRRLVAVASGHRITPAFAACLADLGLDKHLPPGLRDYFEFMRASNAARNRQFQDELGAIVARLNGLGVEPCLVKGAARLVDGLYPDDSWRFMVDLDLLVPEERLKDCVTALCAEGYKAEGSGEIDPDSIADRHYPALLHPQRCASVELHKRLADKPYTPLLPTVDIVSRSQLVRSDVGRVRLLRHEDAIVHLIAHSQFEHHNSLFGLVELRDVVELHLLLNRRDSDLDWTYIMNRFTRPSWRRACLSFIYGTSSMLGTPTPERMTFDLLTKLRVLRVRGQQRSRPAMAVGMLLGWSLFRLYRFNHRPETSRGFIMRFAADPKKYLRLLTTLPD